MALGPGHDRYPGDHGRCWNCGFLGQLGDLGWYEVPPGNRTDGRLFLALVPSAVGRIDSLPTKPACIVWAVDHETEYSTRVAKGEQPQEIGRDILNRPRDCTQWFGYQRGSSPKEHLDWARMLTLEDLQRRAREDSLRIQEDSLRIAEALKDISAQSKDIHEGTARLTEATGRFTTKWTYIAFGIALAALFLAALTLAVTILTYMATARPTL